VKKWLPALALLTLLPATAGAAPVRAVTAPAPVLALAADGSRVAFAAGRSARDCNRVYIWNLGSHAVTKLGRRTHCEQTSTGNAIASLALARDRVLWVHYVGGNMRTWSLWTASVSRRLPLRLRSVTTEAEAAPPIVLGPGTSVAGETMLPYAVGRTVVVLRADGTRAFTYEADGDVVALAAGPQRLAVATSGGSVRILDARGEPVGQESFGGEIDAIRVDRLRVVVQRGRVLEARGPSVQRTWTLPARSRLEDLGSGKVVYVTGGQVRRIVVGTGAQRQLGLGTWAQGEGAQLFVAGGRRVVLTRFR
jgi:hypothetical protein